MSYGVVLVPSTSHAIRAERVCHLAGLKVKLIPTPRQLSSNCGTALRFDWEERETVEQVLRANKVDYDEVHQLEW
ncbi:MAG: DUF3343 domain-containing protein [Anaerolineae bacterium]|jgi:uncharacterized SAM-binding protein YcdF (DUF218 family)|nr:DUF3343 domain-containing protein [Anaerolineae bacterium]MDH7473793.1 DUF3343 domain-containing protein [Anaerolineae bacterium]